MRIALLAALGLVASSAAAISTCDGTVNTLPLVTEPPALVKNSTNGKLFLAGAPHVDPPLRVVHVYGTPYQMGYAQGELLREEVSDLLTEAYDYIYSMIDPYIKFLPPRLRHAIEVGGVSAALELTYWLTKPFIPQRYVDEAQGLADGAGVPFATVMHMALFPELIKASCSIIGAWGGAVASDAEGRLLQLRALDWDTDGPFQKYPVVVVYHPEEGQGHSFATMGWAGFLGAITGFSSANVAVSEKVWLAYDGPSSRAGVPFNFLLRDILQFDTDADQALSRIASAHRTCSIFIGVGDDRDQFKLVEYSHETVNVYNDHNFPAYGNHTLKQGLVYVDKHVQPSHDQCLPALLDKYYGSLSPDVVRQYITSQFRTGDMHIAIYDYGAHTMDVANAAPKDAQGNVVKAYDRTFIRLQMDDLFAEAL